MAKKRRIVTSRSIEDEDEIEEETWGEWFRYKYAKYWYLLIALTVTLFTMLEILKHDEWDINVPLALIAGLGLAVLFSIGYLRIWADKDEEDEGL
ncbi:MAG: hypothetical protein WC375_00760 [Methanomassiliicoccales archaeon]|jgi:hypothetical protein